MLDKALIMPLLLVLTKFCAIVVVKTGVICLCFDFVKNLYLFQEYFYFSNNRYFEPIHPRLYDAKGRKK